MKKDMKWAMNHLPKSDDKNLPIMSLNEIEKAKAFHQSFPQYSETPLTRLDQMAHYLGLGSIFIKDESYRFGLNAFKVLGGSYSMAKYIAKETHRDVSDMPYDVLTSDELRQEFGQATFFTATDGNHGRGVAWAARSWARKPSSTCRKARPRRGTGKHQETRRRRRHPRPQLRRLRPPGSQRSRRYAARRHGPGHGLGRL